MRILAIYRHYWPDATPYARLLRAILEDQVKLGRAATVFTAQPSYNDIACDKQLANEQLNGVKIRRISLLPEKKQLRFLRAVNFMVFLFRATWHVLWNRQYDLIIANTHPPVVMGAVLRLIRRLTGIPFLLHCQDIHPESLVIAGQLRNGPIERFLRRVDTKNCAAAAKVVTLSEDMNQTLQRRDGYSADNLAVINNFALDVYQPAETIPTLFNDTPERPFRVFFAGNMGHFQDLPRLLKAAQELRAESNIQFLFMGTGAELKNLRRLAADLIGKTVFFESFQPVEVAFACMSRSDLGVVSLCKGVYQVAYPSKTMTYLAAGCPLLLLAEAESQLAIDVQTHKLGYVPASLTSQEIADTILTAYHMRERWAPAAREELVLRSEQLFGKSNMFKQWSDLLGKLSLDLNLPSIALPKHHSSHRKAA